MAVLALTVAFRLRPDASEAFLALVRENARRSVADEPGCLRFDVCSPEGGDGREVLLYELYRDRAAFDAHKATAHYAAFDAASRPLVEEKRVAFYAAEPNP